MNAMHIRKIDLNLLVTFEAVYRHGNATLAARELGLTQPAVSHAIRRLRNVYGDPLFIRSKGGMQPTIKADQIAPSVQNALKGINLTLETRFDPGTLNRAFRIGLVGYTAFFLLPDLIERIHLTAPNVSVMVDPLALSDVSPAVSGGDVDFAIGLVGERQRGCAVTPLFADAYRYVARRSHPVVNATLRKRQLSKLRHVSIPLLAEAQKRLSAVANVSFGLTTNNLLSAPFIVSRSDLVAVLPNSVATIFKDYCDLQVLEPPIDLGSYTIGLAASERLSNDDAYSWMKQVIAESASGVGQMLDLSGGPAAHSAVV